MAAVQELDARGEVSPRQELEIFLNGERRQVAHTGTRLNPDFRFGKQLPAKLDKIYSKAVLAGYKKRPNWASIAEAVPLETHPDAMVAWLAAQTLYHEAAERDEEAFRCIRSAHELSPDSPAVAAIGRDYEDWDSDE